MLSNLLNITAYFLDAKDMNCLMYNNPLTNVLVENICAVLDTINDKISVVGKILLYEINIQAYLLGPMYYKKRDKYLLDKRKPCVVIIILLNNHYHLLVYIREKKTFYAGNSLHYIKEDDKDKMVELMNFTEASMIEQLDITYQVWNVLYINY